MILEKNLRKEKLNNGKRTIYILTLDGGGTRGRFVCEILKLLEEFLIENKLCNEKIQDIFDLYIGTSTGAIIASALATKKYKAKDIADKIYTKKVLKYIFGKKQNLVLRTLSIVPMYYSEPKYEIGKRIFGDIKLSEIPCNLIISTFNLRCTKPYFWTNIMKKYPDAKVVDIVNASSAAPTYFPAEKVPFDCYNKTVRKRYIEFKEEECNKYVADPNKDDGYLDGGISCNSPCTIAFAYGKKLFEDDIIKVLSIGTGEYIYDINYEDAKNAGGLWWLLKGDIISLLVDSSNQVNNMESEILADKNYLRINSSDDILKVKMDNIDDNILDNMKKLAKLTFKNYQSQLQEFFEICASPQ